MRVSTGAEKPVKRQATYHPKERRRSMRVAEGRVSAGRSWATTSKSQPGHKRSGHSLLRQPECSRTGCELQHKEHRERVREYDFTAMG
jgi:hypothetical protein